MPTRRRETRGVIISPAEIVALLPSALLCHFWLLRPDSAPALGGRDDTAPGQLPEVAVEEEAQDFKLRQGGVSIFLSPVSWPDVDVARNPDVRTEQGQSC